MNLRETEVASFVSLNKLANTNGVVLFGSSFAREIPVGELKQAFHMDCDLYNRSLTKLSLYDAATVLEDCVTSLMPKKVFLQLGETDLENRTSSIPELIDSYKSLILQLQTSDPHCQIVLVSLCCGSDHNCLREFNRQLELLAKKMHCSYADISPAADYTVPSVRAFSMLKAYMIDKIAFYDAMRMAHV